MKKSIIGMLSITLFLFFINLFTTIPAAVADPQAPPAAAREMKSGSRGIGILIGIKNDLLTIMGLTKGEPAERAGLAVGDAILKINDESTRGMAFDQVSARLRGPEGTRVRLLIQRDGWDSPKEFQIVRGTVVPQDPPGPTPNSIIGNFEVGELLEIGLTVEHYFASAEAAGTAATYPGLEAALRDKYKNDIKKMDALEDRSTISVHVFYDEELRSILADVSFQILKETKTSPLSLDLNKFSPHFGAGSIPLKFQIEISGAYRLGLRGVDKLKPKREEMRSFYKLHHFSISFSAHGPSGEEEGSDGFNPFPAGLPPQTFTVGSLELTAVPVNLSYDILIDIAMNLPGGKRELSNEDLVQKRYVLSSSRQSPFSGTFTVKHNDAVGTLMLTASNNDMDKGSTAELVLNGDITFPGLYLGKTRLSDVRLTFTGSADQTRIRARAPMSALAAGGYRPKGKPGRAADRGEVILIEGSYDFAAKMLKVDAAGEAAPYTIAGPLGLKPVP